MADPWSRFRNPDRPLERVPEPDVHETQVLAPPADDPPVTAGEAPSWLTATRPDVPPVVPFPGPLRPGSHSPAVVGVKRAVSRWRPDLLPWGTFTGLFDELLHDALKAFQARSGIRPLTGFYGRATHDLLRRQRRHDHPSEWAFDSVAIRILEDAFHHPKPADAGLVRVAITTYCRSSILAAAAWHYRQRRRMESLGDSPAAGGYIDCSEHATCARYAARLATRLPVVDPNHRAFDGYGYTGTLIANPFVNAPYEVGDLGIYGNSLSDTGHVVTCYTAGDVSGSAWCSMGSEAGPFAVRLRYRGDLLAVVRPPLLP